MSNGFAEYVKQREREAISARIPGYRTVSAHPEAAMIALGNAWTRRLFDGPFYRSAAPAHPDVPVVSLVFVQSRNGNTIAQNPSQLGGGNTDKHLVYEGLSRVDADAVLSGATTARARRLIFSVWHPELVALRRDLGLGRHPAQVVVTAFGNLPIDDGLMFVEPSLRTFIVAPTATAVRLRDRLGGRAWIEVIEAGEPLSLTRALQQLRAAGLRVISAVGGPRTATTLLNEGLITDLYLTTSAIDAGEPNTPLWHGPRPPMHRVVEKAGTADEAGVRFEHFALRGASRFD